MDLSVGRASGEDLEGVVGVDACVAEGGRRGFLADALRAGHLWVAREGGAVVGFAVSSPSFFGRWFVELLVVRPESRRSGVATALMRRCEDECPAGMLFTSTNESNATMQGLLHGLGYERSGYVENLDEGDPELIFVRRLPES